MIKEPPCRIDTERSKQSQKEELEKKFEAQVNKKKATRAMKALGNKIPPSTKQERKD